MIADCESEYSVIGSVIGWIIPPMILHNHRASLAVQVAAMYSHFVFLSSIFHSLFILWFIIYLLLYSIFCPMSLCSVSIIIFPPSVHYSSPSLSNLDNSTFHPLWLCESSFTFSILHYSLYYSELRIYQQRHTPQKENSNTWGSWLTQCHKTEESMKYYLSSTH